MIVIPVILILIVAAFLCYYFRSPGAVKPNPPSPCRSEKCGSFDRLQSENKCRKMGEYDPADWPDSRTILSEQEAAAKPYKYVCRLTVTQINGQRVETESYGTGFLVKRTSGCLVLTAGHNIRSRKNRTKALRVVIDFPALPSVIVDESRRLWRTPLRRPRRGGRHSLDVGGIDIGGLEEFNFADEDGFALRFTVPFTVGDADKFTILGYPEPRPTTACPTWLLYFRDKKSMQKRFLVRSEGDLESISGRDDEIISYSNWTAGGNSGSPIFKFNVVTKEWEAFGLHTQGDDPLNKGIRISPEVWTSAEENLRAINSFPGYSEMTLASYLRPSVDTRAELEDLLDQTLEKVEDKLEGFRNLSFEGVNTSNEANLEYDKLIRLLRGFYLIETSFRAKLHPNPEFDILDWKRRMEIKKNELQNFIEETIPISVVSQVDDGDDED